MYLLINGLIVGNMMKGTVNVSNYCFFYPLSVRLSAHFSIISLYSLCLLTPHLSLLKLTPSFQSGWSIQPMTRQVCSQNDQSGSSLSLDIGSVLESEGQSNKIHKKVQEAARVTGKLRRCYKKKACCQGH